MARRIALLRAVNVGGRKVVMADLRAAATRAGLEQVSTFIASGNLLYAPSAEPAEEEALLERVIADTFGIAVPVVVRPGETWPAYAAACPFPQAARDAPNRLLLLLSKHPPRPQAAAELTARAQGGEQVALAGDALWIHYSAGVGTSRITPAAIDRAVGSPATGRNHNSVLKLGELAGA